jgi:hypothetical protein
VKKSLILFGLFVNCAIPYQYISIKYPSNSIRFVDITNAGHSRQFLPIIPGSTIEFESHHRNEKYAAKFQVPNGTSVYSFSSIRDYKLSYRGNSKQSALNELTDSISSTLNSIADSARSLGANTVIISQWQHYIDEPRGSSNQYHWQAHLSIYAQAFKD